MGAARMTDPFTPDFVKFVQETLDEWKAVGMSIAVVDGDDVFSKGFGYATLPDTRATPDTLWYTGSTTKAFTTATLAHLIASKEHPVLSKGWQTPISSILRDDFVTQDEWATNHLTLEDAASHRTGLSSNDTTILVEEDGRQCTVKDVVRNLRNFPLRVQPRTEFKYNNEAYATLSHVIETVTGRDLGDVFKETIWRPLGMDATFLDLDQAKDAPQHLSTGYSWDKQNQRYEAVPFLPTGIISGAGAVISNVIDYAKWIRCLLREETPLSKEVHKDIRTPRFIDNPTPEGGMDVSLYGLAWWRTTIHGQVVYWHSGSTISHGALVYWFPDLDYGVVIFANWPTPAREVIMRRLVEDKLDVPLNKRYDIAKDLRSKQRKDEQELRDADKILFPNRPKDPQPPSLDMPKLSGKYHAPGFGTYEFIEEASDEASTGRVLVARRYDLLWKTRVVLRHVSGDFWVAFVGLMDNLAQEVDYLAAEFRFGVDGNPSGLEITFSDRLEANGGKVMLERVQSC
ncbi:beta-lactamase/transpeptidase-like protein [Dactylonectria estremocensis]|uniref:Beta-lactamase/transpeptidase-like protein n=1 Tax=Dactylonectria estremocensis TaxID=1079267 RepID=A0A9P9E4B1_9HYPO|nr:beta-lactamase/transpeptidase-like protein [Dactylonectria estremocensis]